MEPRRRPEPGGRRLHRVRRRRGRRARVRASERTGRRGPGHRPRRRLARPPGRLDPAQDRAHEGHRDRCRQRGRPLRGGRAVDGGQSRRRGARPRQPLGLGARHRRRRLHDGGRLRLVRAPLRPRLQQRARGRAGDRRRRAAPRGRGQRPRPVLGGARRRRELRRRHRDRVRPRRAARGLRRQRHLSGRRALGRAHRPLLRVGGGPAGRGHLDRAVPAAPAATADPGAAAGKATDHDRGVLRGT